MIYQIVFFCQFSVYFCTHCALSIVFSGCTCDSNVFSAAFKMHSTKRKTNLIRATIFTRYELILLHKCENRYPNQVARVVSSNIINAFYIMCHMISSETCLYLFLYLSESPSEKCFVWNALKMKDIILNSLDLCSIFPFGKAFHWKSLV